jgi:excalibur calcium-binding domain-containing protein
MVRFVLCRATRPERASTRLAITCFVLSAFVMLGFATTAVADSGSFQAEDAGGGQMRVTVTATSTTCSGGFCGWFGYVVERHSSLPCRDDTTFLRSVIPFHEGSGTTEQTFVFRPFFPRSTKLCLVLTNGGDHVAAEAVLTLPDGYGVQRSSAYNCDDFSSQSAAQYYFLLYPGDPSALDGDGDGAACESNKCPCGAESIPPEPLPVVPVPAPLVVPPPNFECEEAQRAERRALREVRAAQRAIRRAWRPAQLHRRRAELRARRAALQRAAARVGSVC